jgi:hypothetical protein
MPRKTYTEEEKNKYDTREKIELIAKTLNEYRKDPHLSIRDLVNRHRLFRSTIALNIKERMEKQLKKLKLRRCTKKKK